LYRAEPPYSRSPQAPYYSILSCLHSLPLSWDQLFSFLRNLILMPISVSFHPFFINHQTIVVVSLLTSNKFWILL
jgi:hypothetical protein